MDHLAGDYATNSGCIKAVNAKFQTVYKNQTTKLRMLIYKLIINVSSTPMEPRIIIKQFHNSIIPLRLELGTTQQAKGWTTSAKRYDTSEMNDDSMDIAAKYGKHYY